MTPEIWIATNLIFEASLVLASVFHRMIKHNIHWAQFFISFISFPSLWCFWCPPSKPILELRSHRVCNLTCSERSSSYFSDLCWSFSSEPLTFLCLHSSHLRRRVSQSCSWVSSAVWGASFDTFSRVGSEAIATTFLISSDGEEETYETDIGLPLCLLRGLSPSSWALASSL